MPDDEVAEKLYEKPYKPRRRLFAESRPEDKSGDGLWNAYTANRPKSDSNVTVTGDGDREGQLETR